MISLMIIRMLIWLNSNFLEIPHGTTIVSCKPRNSVENDITLRIWYALSMQQSEYVL